MFGNNIRKGVLLKYRSFIKFQEPPILQGRIHGTELPELGFVHNFRLHWGALATWIKLLWTAFWKLFSGIPHLLGFGYVPAPGTWISRYQVLCARWQERWASGVSLKRALKMQFRNAYFRLLVHPSRKLWPKPNLGNSVPCILPCKIGGSWNLMKDLYLSTASFLTIVYLSKCNKNLLLSQKRHHVG